MKIDKETLSDLLYDDGNGIDGFTLVYKKQISTGRWTSSHEMVVEKDGKYYIAYYSRGLTEYQETYPFDMEDSEIECEEVFKHVRIVQEEYFTTHP